MDKEQLLSSIENMSRKERKNISYNKLIYLMGVLDEEEIIKLSNIIGYPVFTRLCMGQINHKFVLLQDGAAAIIKNLEGEILLQKRADNDKWGVPGGCQELGERFEETIIREIKEETNLDVEEENLKLISVVSGNTRKSKYTNGDVVINNTVLYLVDNYHGNIKANYESKELKFFSLNNLPENLHDADLIEVYKESIKK